MLLGSFLGLRLSSNAPGRAPGLLFGEKLNSEPRCLSFVGVFTYNNKLIKSVSGLVVPHMGACTFDCLTVVKLGCQTELVFL